jgi:hypothetical protein
MLVLEELFERYLWAPTLFYFGKPSPLFEKRRVLK